MIKALITRPAIDLDILDSALQRINDPHYIVMNSHTNYLMWQAPALLENWNEKGSSYSTYKGIPISICEKLKDGEVDII